MTYAIIQVVNGNYSIAAEGITEPSSAFVSFHNLCAALWNASDVQKACVMIVDTNLDVVGGPNGGYKEFISKAQPTAEV